MDNDKSVKIKTALNNNVASGRELSIEGKIDNLLKLDNRVWMHYGLLFSSFYDKLRDIDDIIDNTIRLSHEVAAYMRSSYKSLEDIMRSNNILSYEDNCLAINAFAYYSYPNKIYIAKGVIKELLSYLQGLDSKYQEIFNEQDINRVILAHELFHFYEEKNKRTIYTKRYRVNVFRILGFSYRGRVQAISEIAAMEFARSYTECGFNPYILNFILLSKINEEKANGIYDTVIRLALEEGNCGINNL